MYDLGSHFKFDFEKSKANPECIFKGDKYRITVLTERLLRLEYNDNGMFEDYPTQFAWYRNFPKPEFTVEQNNSFLHIETKYFNLNYRKEKNFKGNLLMPSKNLDIVLKESNKSWYYKHPEARKLESPNKFSLYSLDGFVSVDDSKGTLILENGSFKKRDNSGIDIYLFLYGKNYYYCLSDYFKLTGYPPLISKYALGNWWDKNESYMENEIVKLTNKFIENSIPISVFILNNWQNNNDYVFNKFYNNPKNIIDYIKNKNIKFGLQLYDNPIIKSDNSVFNKIHEYLTLDKNGNIPFNLYDSRTIDSYLKLLIHPLENIGVDLFSLEFLDKKNIDRVDILKHYHYYDNFRSKNKRPLIASLISSIPSHRYPINYTEKIDVSWSGLKKSLNTMISSSNSGISFISSDVGGSENGVEDSELFTRYVELGVFSPILKLGSNGGKYYKREPWKWGLKTREITTFYLNLRYKLIPYIYTESYKYFKYGKTLIEPIYYKHMEMYDDDLYRNEYFFGSTFLVCPIYHKKNDLLGKVIHKLYIPEGVWYDFFTGKLYKGNKRYTSFYRDQEFPVFVKAGSIIPLSLNSFNDVSSPKNMEIQVFPGANNTYSIYEDDGDTNGYLNGNYMITNIEYIYSKDNYKLTILPTNGKNGVIPEKRNYKIRFRNTKRPNLVSSYISNTLITSNSYNSGNDLIVEINDVPTDKQLSVIVNGNDIVIDALRIINDEIVTIISDLPIKTKVKERLDEIMLSNELDIKKKRIAIRKLTHEKDYLEKKYVELFLKLLEYIDEV